jgi:hypothetical protein
VSKQFDYNPRKIMSPAQQHYAAELEKTREKKMQMDESSHVAQVLRGIASKGNDASYGDIVGEIFGKGLSPQSEHALLESVSKYSPKFQENRLAQQKQGQSDKILGQVFGDGGKINNERNQSESPQGSTNQGNYPVQEGTNPQLGSQQQGNEKLNITPQMILAANRVDPSLGNALDKIYQGQKKDENARNALQFKQEKYNEEKADKSYAAHKSFIDEITSSYKAYETETKPRMLQLQQLNEDDLIGPGAASFLEKVGIPLGVLENPSNELYSKVSQDLLKGLPEAYGSRILKVEVDNFLKTIPTLMNSADGRRMIASNILKLGEMKEVFYNEMRRQQKQNLEQGKKFPKDFEQEVFDQVRPQVDKLNNEFLQLSSVKSVPEGTVPFFDPSGGISFVPKNPEAMKWAEQNGGKRIW